MQIEALAENPQGAQYRMGQYRIVNVEVPGPYVLCESNGVRVVATFAPFAGDPEFDPPKLDSLSPLLSVEYSNGENALGETIWLRADRESVGEYTKSRAMNALAHLLYSHLGTPRENFVVTEREAAATT